MLKKIFKRNKISFIKQLNQQQCGPTCLTMVLNFFHLPYSQEEITRKCFVSREGVTALNIKRVANECGLQAGVYKVGINKIRNLKLPAILHWNDNHYVVLEKIKKGVFFIADPALGRIRINMDEFLKHYSGVAIQFQKSNVKQKKRGTVKKRLAFYYRYFCSKPSILVNIFLFTIVVQVATLVVPFFIQYVVDNVLLPGSSNLIDILGISILLLFIGYGIFSIARGLLVVKLQAVMSRHLSFDFFSHMMDLPMRFFESRISGDLASRLNSLSIVREVLSKNGTTILMDLLMLFVYAVVMFFISPYLAVSTIIIAGIQLFLMITFVPRLHRLTQQDLSVQGQTQGYLIEVLRAIQVIKANGLNNNVKQKWEGIYSEQVKVTSRKFALGSLVDGIVGALRIASPLLILWLGIQEVSNNAMTIGQLLAFNVLVSSFLAPIGSLVSNIQQFQLLDNVFKRIEDVFDSEIEKSNGKTQMNIKKKLVSFRDVSFSYSNQDQHFDVKQLNIQIEPGKKTALVGTSGSGKTTILKLLAGMYFPTKGEIYFNDVNLKDMDLTYLRKQIGIVLQDTALFNDTIEKNISFFREADLEDIQRVAEIACLHDDISSMPMGYKTVIGENGQLLSGGQRQRLAIARALVDNPSILILDEATSQLDTLTEKKIDQNLEDHHITRLVIAHRLSTILDADRIYVIKNGEVIETGTHSTLLQERGFYKEMWEKQVGSENRYVEEVL
ncbi:peptidase domain-containing ABC transporter [Oceanobacillus sp. AG]|uniref:peptidase domain-containing ABC transporter n=1 Tax=Oceanobacillus sp. AG TaxID=2681969 RepID=UPI0012EBF0F2|nr:peptidase domain-containing ABC transporter [Oceanobacillus sp. AG]